MIQELLFLNCVPFDNMGTCFFYKNTEQNGPFVLKSNPLFLVPNHERNKLDLNV